MDILNIMQCTQQGGMEQSSLRLMRALQARGHTLRVVSLNPLGALAPDLERAGIPAVGLPYRGALGWRSFPGLWRHLRREKADAVLMTGNNLLGTLALGSLGAGRRLLAMHFHHGERPGWQWRLFYRVADSRFNAISYPSDFVRREAEVIVPWLAPKLRTIRNPLQPPPVATAKEREAARAALGLPLGVPIVGNGGWLVRRKRFDVFLDTAASVARRRPDIRFAIAGDGEERASLERQAAALGIADRVHWLGWVADMSRLYLAIDALLFNSDWDALPTTPIEAMGHGLPVVASVANGGLAEIIPDARFGYLTSRHDPDMLAQALLSALSPEGRASAERGRRRVVELTDPEAIAAEIETLLSSPSAAMSARPVRRPVSTWSNSRKSV